MMILAICLSIICVLIAAVHLLWAIGYWFPIRDEAALVQTVVSVKGAERMPGPIPCSLIVVGLLFAASVPWWGPGTTRTVILILAAIVFTARGMLMLLPIWRRMTSHEPYATLDRRLYSPASLLVGIGFATLVIFG